jgi:LmbE family N-acetylglucosaminyl deacetylase
MISLDGKRILVLAPHPDDEALATGGLIARAKSEGASVFVLFFAVGTVRQYGSVSDGPSRIAEMHAAAEVLELDGFELLYGEDRHLLLDSVPRRELVDAIERGSSLSLDRLCPDIVIMPGASYNQDHNAVSEACITALRPYPPSIKASPDLILAYSHLDEECWNIGLRRTAPNVGVDISSSLDRKLVALRCYQSQMKSDPVHWRSEANVAAANKLAGRRIGVLAAEEYSCLRLRM